MVRTHLREYFLLCKVFELSEHLYSILVQFRDNRVLTNLLLLKLHPLHVDALSSLDASALGYTELYRSCCLSDEKI